MRRPFLSLAGFGLVTIALSAQADWQKTATAPASHYVTGLASVGSTLFAATNTRGVFRSTDFGATWSATNAGIPPADSSVRCLAVAGASIFAGTLDGVYRSTDLGVSWLSDTIGMKSTSNSVYAFALDGIDLYAGTYKCNVYVSSLSGSTWTQTKSKLSDTGVTSIIVKDGFLFAGTEGHGIYRSPDKGVTWTTASVGLADTSDSTIRRFTNVGANLFAGTRGGVFRSADYGGTWQATAKVGHTSTYSLAVDGTVVFAGAYAGVIYRSADSARTWTAVNKGITDTTTIIHSLAVCDSFLFAGTGAGGSGIWRRPLPEFRKSPIIQPMRAGRGTRACEVTGDKSGNVAQFRVSLASADRVTLRIFNLRGELIASVIDDKLSAGSHLVRWDRRFAPEQRYVYQCISSSLRETRTF